jgi:hypothetical protein
MSLYSADTVRLLTEALSVVHYVPQRSRCSDWLRAGRLGARFFSSPRRPDRLCVAHPASYPKVPGVNWPGREADHSPPTSAEVKNTWSYTFTPPYVFMA